MTNSQAERLFSALFPPDLPQDARILLATYDRTASHALTHYYSPSVPEALATLDTFPDTIEVFFCPLPRLGENARKGGAHPNHLTWLFADIDYQKVDPDRYTKLYYRIHDHVGSYSVTSGSVDPLGEAPPNEHVYAHLSRPVTPDEHECLNYAFGKSLGADSKYTDNTLLRVPGTYNHKTAKPRRSRLATIAPERLLPVGPLTRALERYGRPAAIGSAASLPPWQKVPVDRVPSRYVRAARTPMDDLEMGRYDGDRSRAVYAVAKDMINAGLTRDEIHTLMDDFPPALDKRGTHPKYDHHNDIDRLWLKLAPAPAESSEIAMLPPPAPTPTRNALPPLGRVFEALHRHAGSLPPQMVDIAALVTAATLMPRVTMPSGGKTVRACLWGLVVAESGSGKSVAVDYVNAPVAEIERDNITADKKKQKELAEKEEVTKKKISYRDVQTDRFLYQDSTYESMIDSVQRNTFHCIMINADEIDAMVDKMGGKGGGNHSLLLSAWNCNGISQNRRGFEGIPIEIPDAVVNICGGIQPESLPNIGSAAKGQLPRYLVARVMRYELADEIVSWSRCPDWDKLVNELYGSRHCSRQWSLSDEAESLFRRQDIEWQRAIKRDSTSTFARAFYGKAHEMTKRLALVLAELDADDHSTGGVISAEIMQRALDVMNHSLKTWTELEDIANPSGSVLVAKQESHGNLSKLYQFVQDRSELFVSATYINRHGPLKRICGISELKSLLRLYNDWHENTVWIGNDPSLKRPRPALLVFREVPPPALRKSLSLKRPTATDFATA